MILTDSAGLTAGLIRIPVKDGDIPGYRAMPSQGEAFPVVLVIEEIFGVHEYIQDVCRRFAKLGYLAIAPELFARLGDPTKLDRESAMKMSTQAPDAQVMADLDATVEFAAIDGKGDQSRLAINGFCWGGRVSWLYAAHNAGLKTAVAWYGRVGGPRDALHPRHPIDVVEELKCPVLGLYGAHDQSIPVDTVEQMQQALRQAGRDSEIVIFPEAGHAFHADYRPTYNQQAAEDGWRRAIDWLRRHGVA